MRGGGGEGEREARKEGGKRSENVHCGLARSRVFLGLPSLSPHRLPTHTWTCWRPAHSQAPLGIRGRQTGDPFRHTAQGALLWSGPGRPPRPSAPICRGQKAEGTLGLVAVVMHGGRRGEGAHRWHLLCPALWAGEAAPTAYPPAHTQARLVSEQRSGPWSLAARSANRK